ncbi:hypothetical protein JW948_01155 [bacterium]|nr:hypothetical protein [bacterium]
MINKKMQFGILSMACLFASIGLAAFTLSIQSPAWTLFYLALCAIAGIAVTFAFCSKCPVKSACPHVLPGFMTRIMNDRTPGSYTRFELMVTFLSIGIILFFPQVWLIRYPFRFGLFWILAGAGLMLIVKNICRRCRNVYCPFRK